MKKIKETEANIERYEIESKKEWRELSTNNLHDMYMEKTQGSNEFSLHAKGTMKTKTPPPPVEPPDDIQGVLKLLIKRMDSMEVNMKQGFNRLEEKVDDVIKLNHLKTSSDDEK